MDNKPFRIKGRGPKKPNRNFKNAGFVALLILFGLIIYASLNQPNTLKSVAYSDVIKRANSGEIQRIEISGDELTVTPKGESKPTEKSRKEAGSSIYEQGLNKDANVEVDNKPESNSGAFWQQLGL